MPIDLEIKRRLETDSAVRVYAVLQRGQCAPPWAVPQLGSCTSSGRAWRQGEATPLGCPRHRLGGSSEPPPKSPISLRFGRPGLAQPGGHPEPLVRVQRVPQPRHVPRAEQAQRDEHDKLSTRIDTDAID